MKQPKMKVLSTGEIHDVVSLVWMDRGTTLRAFPMKVGDDGAITNYVIVKGDGEDSEVSAILLPHDYEGDTES